jgi:phenylalanyl-tRNA synthetase beta chain
MKISISWLSEYLELPATQEKLEDVLNGAGLTVEGVHVRGANFPQVVVARILESVQHPNADRLSVCQVEDGSGQPRQIVCGAKNYKVGDKVPLALPGAVLPGDFKIKTGKLRGVESEGMMCSAKELELASDAAGLLILPETAVVGAPISSVFPADTTLELEVTPNRPDCLSHLGIAREISAFTGAQVRRPEVSELPAISSQGASIEAPAACPFYSIRKISGVTNRKSPDWLSARLESIGLRSIDVIVDITNFVMMELGQPLHAFDAAKVRGEMRVRFAAPGEKFRALDGRDYELGPSDLVIADDASILALAGVMGGEASGVSVSTTEVLLESAIFDPATVRRSARRLGLHSDSSYRFERGLDPEGVNFASARSTDLIVEWTGGKAASELVAIGTPPEPPAGIPLRPERCRALLGAELSDSDMETSLRAFGLVRDTSGHWQVPTHRLDLTREVDLIEEISRRVGIQRIPSRLNFSPSPAGKADRTFDFCSKLRRSLAGAGFSEARTSTLISEEMAADYVDTVRLKNPLGVDQVMLRPGLVPALQAALTRNLRFGEKAVRLFEIGKVFAPSGETLSLGLVITGPSAPPHWQAANPPISEIFFLKGLLESLFDVCVESTESAGNQSIKANLLFEGQCVGWMAQLSPQAARRMDAQDPVFVAELNLENFLNQSPREKTYSAVSEFPSTTRDIAIVAPIGLSYAALAAEISSAKEPLLMGFKPFDVFQDPTGQKLSADSKSLAISLTFQSSERTLQTEEVNAATDRIKSRLKSVLAVSFRE